MEHSKKIIKIFLFGIFASLTLILPAILDLSLVPRFIGLSVTLLVFLFFLNKLRLNPIIKLDLILLSYLVFVIYCLCSAFWSQNVAESLFSSFKQLLGFLVFLLSYFCFKIDYDYFLERLLKIAAITSLIFMAFGIYQFMNITDFNKESLYRITGLNGHKNLLASFLFLNLFFLIGAVIELKGVWKILATIALILSLAFIIILRTKAVWIGFFVLFFAILIFYFKTISKKPISTWIVVSLFIIAANILFLRVLEPVILKSIATTTSASTKVTNGLDQERLIVWAKTYHVIHKHLFFGVGAGNWQVHFPDASLTGLWRVEDLNFTFQRPHNDFLWILSETGLIGFNLYLIFVFLIIILLVKCINLLNDNKKIRTLAVFCLAFILGFLTVSFFDFPKERIEHTILINIIFAIAYYVIRTAYPLKTFIQLSSLKPMFMLGFSSLLFILAFGLLRYKGEYYTIKLYDSKREGNYESTKKYGKLALSYAYNIDPTSIPLHWQIANAEAALRDFENAERDFRIAYGYNPYNRNVINDWASALLMTGKAELAKKHYAEAARISPRFDDPKLNLAAIYLNEKNFKMAKFWLNSLLHNSRRRSNYERILEVAESH